MTSLHIDHVIHDVLDAHPLYARDCPDGLDKFNCSHVVEIIKEIIRKTVGVSDVQPCTSRDVRFPTIRKFLSTQDLSAHIWTLDGVTFSLQDIVNDLAQRRRGYY
jgi:hypothetical protein